MLLESKGTNECYRSSGYVVGKRLCCWKAKVNVTCLYNLTDLIHLTLVKNDSIKKVWK